MSVSIEWLGFAAITLSVLAYLPQITHLIRERCSAGLSPGAYCMWVVSAVLLLTYSIAKNDLVFILLQSYQAAAGLLVLNFCLKYKGQLCEAHGGEPLSLRLERSQGDADPRGPVLPLPGSKCLAAAGPQATLRFSRRHRGGSDAAVCGGGGSRLADVIQGGEQPELELHPGQDGAAPSADRGERGALSSPAGQCRPPGVVSDT